MFKWDFFVLILVEVFNLKRMVWVLNINVG